MDQMENGYSAKVKAFRYGEEKRLFKQDIMGSLAHCAMLGEYGILTQVEAESIKAGLSQIFFEYSNGKLTPPDDECMFGFIKKDLARRIGVVADKLELGRSRADRTALNLKLYLRESVDELNALLKAVILQLSEFAFDNARVLMPAYTHGRKVAPSSLAQFLLSFAQAFMRDAERLAEVKKRLGTMPLGVCDGTGTTLPISRKRVAEILGFAAVTANGLDTLADRDYVIDYLSALSLAMLHLSDMADAFAQFSAPEYGFFRLPDAFVSGRTAAPVVLEGVRAKTGRVSGVLSATLTMLHAAAPGGHDLDDCLDAVFCAEQTVRDTAEVMLSFLYEVAYDEQKLTKAAVEGNGTVGDLTAYLIERGMSAADADRTTDRVLTACAEYGKRPDTLAYEQYAEISPLFGEDIPALMRAKNAVRFRRKDGEPGEGAVKTEIRNLKRKLYRLLPDAQA